MNKKIKKLSILLGSLVLIVSAVGVGTASAALTFDTTSITGTANVTLAGVASSIYTIGAANTTGAITIGGTGQTTGIISLGDTASSTVSEISIGGGDGIKTINIGDGAGANTILIGGGAGTVAINSGDWDITTTGNISGVGTLAMGGALSGATTGAFSDTVTLSKTTNQLILGTTTTTTISSVAPAVSRTYTIPDNATASVNFVLAPTSATATEAMFATTTAGAPAFRAIADADVPNTITIDLATLATTGTNTAITDDAATNATMYPTWVTTTTGNLPQKTSSTKLTFNPSTGMLTATGFTGALTGNVTGNASGTALTVTQAAQTTITSVGTLTGLTMGGNLAMGVNNITGTGAIAATTFTGALTGNVTGNASGTALTVTQAAQTTITSVGTLTGLTVAGAITIGAADTIAEIVVGQGTDDNTISIGKGATLTTKTQIINIGAVTPAGTGKAVITIGNTGGAGSVTLKAGTGGILLGGTTAAPTTVNGAFNYAGTSGGAADVQTATITPAPTANTLGMVISFKAGFSNATTTPTFDLNSLGALTIVKRGAAVLAAGDILINGYYIMINTGANWQLINPVVN